MIRMEIALFLVLALWLIFDSLNKHFSAGFPEETVDKLNSIMIEMVK